MRNNVRWDGWTLTQQHAKFIKGVSVGPLILYRYGSSTKEFLEKIKSQGASEAVPGNLDKLGYSDLNISADFSNKKAISTALEISKELMSERDYYDLKSFNYFKRNLNFDEFHHIAMSAPEESIPFNRQEKSELCSYEMTSTYH